MLEYAPTIYNNNSTEDYTSINRSTLSHGSDNETSDTVKFGNKSWEALAIMCIIAVVATGNVLAILAVSIDRKLQSSTNYFLMSLAVADLLVALTVMPPSLAMIVNNYSWPFPEMWCGIWVMLDVCFSTSSILHLCMISLDRYMALANPLGNNDAGKPCGFFNKLNCCRHEHNYISPMLASGSTKGVKKRIVLVWATSLGIALPLPILQSKNRSNVFVGQMCAINIADFQIYASFVAFFLPLVIMMVVYSLTIRSLQKQAKFISQMLGNNSTRIHPRQTVPTLSTNNSFNRNSVRSYGRQEEGVNKDLSDLNHKKKTSVRLTNTRNSCWKVLSNHFAVSRAESDWASNDCEELEYSECRRNRKGLKKSDSDSSKGSGDSTRSPLISRANLTLGKALNKVYRGKSTVSRKISSSIRAKAIANISTEQRASKVLGLIFVLFCLFWCPFFITNVTSRLCHTCDEETVGQLMNWFVWAGYVSSGVNPLVYTLFSRRFRTTFHYLLTCNYSKINHSKKFAWRTSEDNQNSSFRRSHSHHTDKQANTDVTSVTKLALPTESELAITPRITRNSYHSRSVLVRPKQPSADSEFIRGTHSACFTRKNIQENISGVTRHSSVTNVKKYWRTTWPSPVKENKQDSVMSHKPTRTNSLKVKTTDRNSNDVKLPNEVKSHVGTQHKDNLTSTNRMVQEQERGMPRHFSDQLLKINVEYCDDHKQEYFTNFKTNAKKLNNSPSSERDKPVEANNNRDVIICGKDNTSIYSAVSNSKLKTPVINIDENALGEECCVERNVQGFQICT